MKTEFSYQLGDELKTVTVEQEGDRFRVRVGQRSYEVALIRAAPGQLDLAVGQRRLQAQVVPNGRRRYVAVGGQTWVFETGQPQRQRPRPGPRSMPGSGSLEATMPGLVLEVLVSAGQAVQRGDSLVVLEAMKMELRLTAPYAGRVLKVHCAAGQVVERGQLLVELEENRPS